MTDDLSLVEDWAAHLLSQLQPRQRRELSKEIGRELRRSQQSRIAAQQNPDGTPYEARKPRKQKNFRGKKGRIRKAAMFAKIRAAKWLKLEADGDGVALGFAGRVARLARIHQEGETDQVAPGGPTYRYPVRELLGFTQEERDMIQDKILAHVTRK
jgi:phage virion morphogenesis protein